MLDDLREQMILEEEPFEFEEQRRSPLQFIQEMEPWKRLVLAILLFLDIALCGCMGLAMIGRVSPPF